MRLGDEGHDDDAIARLCVTPVAERRGWRYGCRRCRRLLGWWSFVAVREVRLRDVNHDGRARLAPLWAHDHELTPVEVNQKFRARMHAVRDADLDLLYRRFRCR